jgi:hypothetical protein
MNALPISPTLSPLYLSNEFFERQLPHRRSPSSHSKALSKAGPFFRMNQKCESVDEKQNYRKPDTTDHQSDPGGRGWLYFQVDAVIASVTEPTRSFTVRVERPNMHLAK